ncbi:MAG: hypothetical protein M3164_00670 [Actinomycetota bacterium]|nr:hypothetical protein [Actinomycetota bacterium]
MEERTTPGEADLSGDEEATAAGELVPPRDASGTPSAGEDDYLTDEAEEAVETEVATGESVDRQGRPLPTEPPPLGSDEV